MCVVSVHFSSPFVANLVLKIMPLQEVCSYLVPLYLGILAECVRYNTSVEY